MKAETEITEIKLFTHGTSLKYQRVKCHASGEVPGLSNGAASIRRKSKMVKWWCGGMPRQLTSFGPNLRGSACVWPKPGAWS